MKDRIAKLVGWEQARYLWMGTFHSIFSRILRKEAEAIGFTSNFTIYDQSDSRSLIKAIIKEMGLDDKVYKPASVQARISNAKNHLILPQSIRLGCRTFSGRSDGQDVSGTRHIFALLGALSAG